MLCSPSAGGSSRRCHGRGGRVADVLARGTAAIVAAALLVACGGKTERDFTGTGTGDASGSDGTGGEGADGSGGTGGSASSTGGRGDRADVGTGGVDGSDIAGTGGEGAGGEQHAGNGGVVAEGCPLTIARSGEPCAPEGGACTYGRTWPCGPAGSDCFGADMDQFRCIDGLWVHYSVDSIYCTCLSTPPTGGAAGASGSIGAAGKAEAGGEISVTETAGTAGGTLLETCRGPGAALCDSECVNVLTDSLHCGACEYQCTGGQWCQDGTCACAGTDTFCNGQCVNTLTSSLHCGVCDNACATGDCVDGVCEYGPEGPSCAGGLDCNGESCCTSILVPGGTFPMGRCGAASVSCSDAYDGLLSEIPEHSATISSFYLDKYELTVGRFRAFVEAFDGGWRPSVGDGANSAVETAQGLAAGATGWQSAWDSELPTAGYEVTAGDGSLEDRITCSSSYETWTSTAGANEQYPMNCVSWYEAFASCIWDGGRLPTEAEWEYVAAGGDENRVYPWGNDVPEPLPADYSDNGDSPSIAVGSYPGGDGRWGHADLAGSMFEWTLDWYAGNWYTTVQAGCADCANLTAASSHRVLRGGNWSNPANYLRAASRFSFSPDNHHYSSSGVRCSRTP